MRRATLVGLLVLVIGPSSLHAQRPDSVQVGARVRVSYAPLAYRLTGTLLHLDADSLTLRPDRRIDPVRLPRSSITRLELSQGRRTGRGALIGLATGAGVGIALGVALKDRLEATEADPSFGRIPAIGGAIFGGLGALIGAAAGSQERWRPAQLEAALALDPMHRCLEIQVRLPFRG